MLVCCRVGVFGVVWLCSDIVCSMRLCVCCVGGSCCCGAMLLGVLW